LITVDPPAQIDVQVAGAVFLAVLRRMIEPTAASESGSDKHAAAHGEPVASLAARGT
jgi:hypothetical protein